MIGHDIELTVLSVEGEVVKLGIQAPRAVEIFRREVYEAIQEANQEASLSKVSVEQLRQWKK